MNNTRQILNFKINTSAQEINNLLNNYLKKNNFIQTDYNDEKVLKLNSLYAKQSFYATYIKIYLSNDEITVIGWINYKGKEYGFDDKLDFKDLSNDGNWKPIKELYSIFFTIASSFKIDDNIKCEKVLSRDIKIPEIQNLFIPNIEFGENKNHMKYSGAITFTIFSIILYIISLTSSTDNAKYTAIHFIQYIVPLIFVPFSLKKVIKNKNSDKTAKTVFIINIVLIVICIVSGLINLLMHI